MYPVSKFNGNSSLSLLELKGMLSQLNIDAMSFRHAELSFKRDGENYRLGVFLAVYNCEYTFSV